MRTRVRCLTERLIMCIDWVSVLSEWSSECVDWVCWLMCDDRVRWLSMLTDCVDRRMMVLIDWVCWSTVLIECVDWWYWLSVLIVLSDRVDWLCWLSLVTDCIDRSNDGADWLSCRLINVNWMCWCWLIVLIDWVDWWCWWYSEAPAVLQQRIWRLHPRKYQNKRD